jgi:hypothetical protein
MAGAALGGAFLAATASQGGGDEGQPTVTGLRTRVHPAWGGGSWLSTELQLVDAEGEPVACTAERLANLGLTVGVSLEGCGTAFQPWSKWDAACTRPGHVDLALVLDVGGPGLAYASRTKRAAVDLAERALAGAGRVAVVRAAEVPEVVVPLTSDRDKVRNGIREIEAYADAREVRAGWEARAIVVVTDGGDDSARLRRELPHEDPPWASLADVRARTIGGARAPVTVIGVGDEVDAASLGSLATATGGRYLPAEPYGLGEVFDRIAFPANAEVVVSLLGADPGLACAELSWAWQEEGTVVTGSQVDEVTVPRADCVEPAGIRTAFGLRDQVAEAFCAATHDGGSEAPRALGAAELTLKACHEAADGFVQGWWGATAADLDGRIAKGATRLDPERARRCVEALCALPATHTILGKLQWPESCRAVFQGRQHAGETCETPQDCAGDLVCRASVDGCSGACEPGTGRSVACEPACGLGQACYPLPKGPSCLPVGREHAACRNAFECASGLVCDYASYSCMRPEPDLEVGEASRPWVDGCPWPSRCVPDGQEGYRCGTGRAQDETCRADWIDCRPGFFCDAADGARMGTCQARRQAGTPCERDFECTDFCAPEGVCDDRPRKVGEACGDADECMSEVCASGTCAAGCPT